MPSLLLEEAGFGKSKALDEFALREMNIALFELVKTLIVTTRD